MVCLLLLLLQGDVVLQLSSLLSNYQQRNITTVFDNRYPVWKVRHDPAINSQLHSMMLKRLLPMVFLRVIHPFVLYILLPRSSLLLSMLLMQRLARTTQCTPWVHTAGNVHAVRHVLCAQATHPAGS
jgi:hypothetical protein